MDFLKEKKRARGFYVLSLLRSKILRCTRKWSVVFCKYYIAKFYTPSVEVQDHVVAFFKACQGSFLFSWERWYRSTFFWGTHRFKKQVYEIITFSFFQLKRKPERIEETNDNGRQILDIACSFGQNQTALMLLELGANSNFKTGSGLSPLRK